MKILVFDTLTEYAKKVRKEVFMQEQGFQNEFDEIDNIAWHIVMFHEEEPVAACRVYEDKEKETFVIGRLAVIKKYRGKNYGSDMVNKAISIVAENGGDSVSLHAQCRVKKFYRSLGFHEYGKIEDDEGCPHIWMKKSLVRK